MQAMQKQPLRCLATCGATLGLLGVTGLAASASVQCSVLAEPRSGGYVIGGAIVSESSTIAGSYRLQAGSGSGTHATQSAPYTASPGQPAAVGTVVLAVPGPVDVTLTVNWSGGTTSCTRRLP